MSTSSSSSSSSSLPLISSSLPPISSSLPPISSSVLGPVLEPVQVNEEIKDIRAKIEYATGSLVLRLEEFAAAHQYDPTKDISDTILDYRKNLKELYAQKRYKEHGELMILYKAEITKRKDERLILARQNLKRDKEALTTYLVQSYGQTDNSYDFLVNLLFLQKEAKDVLAQTEYQEQMENIQESRKGLMVLNHISYYDEQNLKEAEEMAQNKWNDESVSIYNNYDILHDHILLLKAAEEYDPSTDQDDTMKVLVNARNSFQVLIGKLCALTSTDLECQVAIPDYVKQDHMCNLKGFYECQLEKTTEEYNAEIHRRKEDRIATVKKNLREQMINLWIK